MFNVIVSATTDGFTYEDEVAYHGTDNASAEFAFNQALADVLSKDGSYYVYFDVVHCGKPDFFMPLSVYVENGNVVPIPYKNH